MPDDVVKGPAAVAEYAARAIAPCRPEQRDKGSGVECGGEGAVTAPLPRSAPMVFWCSAGVPRAADSLGVR